MKSISRLIDLVEDRNDVWLVYEVGSLPLGKYLTEVKGEFFRGERIYNVAHQEFYEALLGDKRILHSDIKPDNILVKMNEECGDIEEIKLIDFGSAF
jgi:serine/threonine protein kinase